MKEKFFRVPFAQSGNTQVIPDSKSADGSVSFAEGWGEDYEKDLLTDANAKPVERKAMNAVLNNITTAIRALQTDSLPEWITAQDNAGVEFPYNAGVMVRYNGKTYLSLATGNTKTPGTDATKWQDISGPVIRTVNDHAPDANGNVKLGTAADKDATTSEIDTTKGRLMALGDRGIGGDSVASVLFPGTTKTAADVMKFLQSYGGGSYYFNFSSMTDFPKFSIGSFHTISKSENGMFLVVPSSGDAYAIGMHAGVAYTNRLYGTKNPPPLPTPEEINALPLTGGTMTGETKSTSGNILRGIQGGYGAILRMDANGLYFLQTNKDDPNGNYNGNRSLTIDNNGGAVTVGTPFTVNNASEFITKTGVNPWTDDSGQHNQTNGLRLKGNGNLVADIALHELVNNYLALTFHVYGTGGDDGWFDMRAPGHFLIGGGDPQMHVGNAWMTGDGNIWGTRWNPDGEWLWDAIVALVNGNNGNFARVDARNVGSLCFAILLIQDGKLNYGDTVSGGDLRSSGVTLYPSPSGGDWSAGFTGEQLPGTWRCLGYAVCDTDSHGNKHYSTTLYVRIL